MTDFAIPGDIVLGGEKGRNGDEVKQRPQPSREYFRREHHNPSSYGRIENWLPDVKQFTFQTTMVPISALQAKAILKYRDETKLRGAVRDQERREALSAGDERWGAAASGEAAQDFAEKSIHDPKFLDSMYAFILDDWSKDKDKEVNAWHTSLKQLEQALDTAIHSVVATRRDDSKNNINNNKNNKNNDDNNNTNYSNNRDSDSGGVFIKLSTRSPKDASLNLTKTHEHIKSNIRASSLVLGGGGEEGKASKEIVKEDLRFVNEAASSSLCVTTGAEALRLLLESDRAHSDITANQLYLEGDENFNLQIAVREWCSDVDSDWEFRLFVVDGKSTALTIYNDFYYDARIVANKEAIQAQILSLWEKVRHSIDKKTKNYCIDFAVTPSLEKTFIIEVNNFLAPIAGSGLFKYNKMEDRKLLEEGPFSFRVRTAPLVALEEEIEGVGIRTLHPPLVAMMKAERLAMARKKQKQEHKATVATCQPDASSSSSCSVM
uniref:Cell division cycle protein 123 n=2 Tax=Lotharella globosa TaxID=91324 RepID=A0A7S4DHE3_9EUKA